MAKRLLKRELGFDPVKLQALGNRVTPKVVEPVERTEAIDPDTSPLERRSCEKRVLLTPSEQQAIERQVQQLAAELRTTVKLSHILRASLRAFQKTEQKILEQAKLRGPLSRPPNGDAKALNKFEEEITEILLASYR